MFRYGQHWCVIRLLTHHARFIPTNKVRNNFCDVPDSNTYTLRWQRDSHTLHSGSIRLDTWTEKNNCTKFLTLHVSALFLRDHFGSVKFMKAAIMTVFSEIFLLRNDQKARDGIWKCASRSIRIWLRNALCVKDKQARNLQWILPQLSRMQWNFALLGTSALGLTMYVSFS